MYTHELEAFPSYGSLWGQRAEMSEEEKGRVAAGDSVQRYPLDPVTHGGCEQGLISSAAKAFRRSPGSNFVDAAELLLSRRRPYGNLTCSGLFRRNSMLVNPEIRASRRQTSRALKRTADLQRSIGEFS